MKKQKPVKPVALGDDSKTLSERPKQMKNSKRFDNIEMKLSWGNIQDQIAALLYATKKVPESVEILNISLEYAGGTLGADKVIPVKVLTRKGVQTHYF